MKQQPIYNIPVKAPVFTSEELRLLEESATEQAWRVFIKSLQSVSGRWLAVTLTLLAVTCASTAWAGDVTISPSESGAGNQTMTGVQGQSQDNVQTNSQVTSQTNSGTTTQAVTVERVTSSATAPALTTGNDACMGSTSLGAQGMSFGLSFGTTWSDENCKRIKKAHAINQLGYPQAALKILMDDKEIARAMREAYGTRALLLDME